MLHTIGALVAGGKSMNLKNHFKRLSVIVLSSALLFGCGKMTQAEQEAKLEDDLDKQFVGYFSNFDFNSVTWGEKSDEFINDALIKQTGCYYGTYERGSHKYTALCFTPEVLAKLGYESTEEEAWWYSAQMTDWAENMQKVDLSKNTTYNYKTAWTRIHANKYIDLSKETHSLPKLDTIWAAFDNTQEADAVQETPDVEESSSSIEAEPIVEQEPTENPETSDTSTTNSYGIAVPSCPLTLTGSDAGGYSVTVDSFEITGVEEYTDDLIKVSYTIKGSCNNPSAVVGFHLVCYDSEDYCIDTKAASIGNDNSKFKKSDKIFISPDITRIELELVY